MLMFRSDVNYLVTEQQKRLILLTHGMQNAASAGTVKRIGV
jgi:hypothetical protein